MGMQNVEYFDSIYDEVFSSKGIIIDLRNSLGGASIGYLIANYFTTQDTITQYYYVRQNNSSKRAFGAFVDSTNSNYEYFHGYHMELDSSMTVNNIDYKKRFINKNIVFLINNDVVSAAENFLMVFKSLDLATFVGTPTYGSCSQPLFIGLPKQGYARISTQKTMLNKNTEFTFITPDFLVPINYSDIINQNDPIFEKGINVLREQLR